MSPVYGSNSGLVIDVIGLDTELVNPNNEPPTTGDPFTLINLIVFPDCA